MLKHYRLVTESLELSEEGHPSDASIMAHVASSPQPRISTQVNSQPNIEFVVGGGAQKQWNK